MIPKATSEIPKDMIELLSLLGKKWRKFNENNLFDQEVLAHWDAIIKKWSKDDSLPLVIRNARAIRGGVTTHVSGREIIFCDNSTAKWVAEKVFLKERPSIDTIKTYIENDEMPFTFAHEKGEKEKSKYKCISKNHLNKAGWKLCHIESVGLKNQKNIETQDLNRLKTQFELLLNPNNFFIVPKAIGGLGEVKWFIDSMK